MAPNKSYISENWNWAIGTKIIADLSHWAESFPSIEEPYASPDGEKIAAVVSRDNMEFEVCEQSSISNGFLTWEESYDKITYLRYTPDNRLSALVSSPEGWTVSIDGNPWETSYDFLWNTRFSPDGKFITLQAQNERRYLAVTNDVPWNATYESLSNLETCSTGNNVAAVVQTVVFNEGEIDKFKEGCYSVAVNGETWPVNFVNVWDLTFSGDGASVAANVRTTLYDYTVAIDGKTWKARYNSVWKPAFNPADGSVTAPVRIKGSWHLVKDGEPFWKKSYIQLWNHIYSSDGRNIAAVVSPAYGRWTVAVNDKPWNTTFGELVSDPVFSPGGESVACLAKDNGSWKVVVNGTPFSGDYEMAWPPVFSPDGTHVAAKVERNGGYAVVVNGIELAGDFKHLWPPVFSPDSSKLLIRAIGKESHADKFFRQVIAVKDLA